MIFLDRREPDELADKLRIFGVEVTHDSSITLEYGDIMFEGHGERGSAMIALERKKLSDLINSMKDRRLSGHQLRGLWKCYDYVFLVCEGMWRPGSSGEIEHYVNRKRRLPPATKGGKPRWAAGSGGWEPFYASSDKMSVKYRQLASYLCSLQLRSRHAETGEPVRVIRTQSVTETAAAVAALYYNFTEKEWGKHHAHDQIYSPIPPKHHGSGWARPHGHNVEYDTRRMFTNEGNPTTTWRTAAQLPGVDRTARRLAAAQLSMRDMTLIGLEPKLKRKVDEWFAANPAVALRGWQDALGIEKGEKTAAAVLRAVGEVGA